MSGGELGFDAGIVWLIGALFFVLAMLYSSVGHAGASVPGRLAFPTGLEPVFSA